jgi:hypothetical protein
LNGTGDGFRVMPVQPGALGHIHNVVHMKVCGECWFDPREEKKRRRRSMVVFFKKV